MMNDIVNDPEWQCNQPPLFSPSFPASCLIINEPRSSNDLGISSTIINIQRANKDTVFMGVYETKLCVIVQHNGEPSRKDDTVIRKLMRFNFVLRYYESWAGNEFDWCNDGVVLDFFDFCYLRVHLHDAHREKIKKCDQHRYALRSLRVAGGLLCSFRYKDGYPVGMFLWRTVHELPPQLQSVHVVEGYKGLQHLLEAALMHVHKVTKLPFNSEPDFFQTLDWHTVVG